MYKLILGVLIVSLFSASLVAQDLKKVQKPVKVEKIKIEREGSGGMTGSFPGFNEVTSAKLQKALDVAKKLVSELDVTSHVELKPIWDLETEMLSSKYIQIKNKTVARANRYPGDYNWGGFLVASTTPKPGSATYIYPGFLDNDSIDETQVAQMVIEEALHRCLPEPTNRYEKIVKTITRMITSNSGDKTDSLIDYVQRVKSVKLPWSVSFYIQKDPRVQSFDYPDRYFANIKRALQNTNRVIETTASARIKIVMNERADTIEVHDVYNKTLKSIPAPYPGFTGNSQNIRNMDYNYFVKEVLKEIDRIEFLQTL